MNKEQVSKWYQFLGCMYPWSIWWCPKTIQFTLMTWWSVVSWVLLQMPMCRPQVNQLWKSGWFYNLFVFYGFSWHSNHKVPEADSYKCETANFRVTFCFCCCKAGLRCSFSIFRFAIEVLVECQRFELVRISKWCHGSEYKVELFLKIEQAFDAQKF